MAEFNKLTITNKGQALMAKLIAGKTTVEFTKVSSSTNVYTEAQILDLTSLANIKQTVKISKITRTNNVAVQIEAAMENSNLTSGYNMNSIGLYAKDPIKDINGNIIYSKDTEIMVKETDANGQITFDNLYLGSYYLQELKTDEKYRLNSRKYSINLEDENKEEVVKTITIQNFLQKGNIIITKTSSLTKENLSNALIGIFNDKDELIYEGTTNQEGKIVIENLALGNYYIKELTAPAGYNLDIKPIKFSITSDKETIYLNLENDPIIDIPDTYSPKCKNIVIIELIESFVLILCYIQIKKSLNYYN